MKVYYIRKRKKNDELCTTNGYYWIGGSHLSLCSSTSAGSCCGELIPEVRFDKGVEFTIHDASDVRSFAPRPDVLDELVRVEDVVAYLLPPFRLHHVATDLLDLRCTLFLCDHQQLRFEPTESLYFVGQLTPLLCIVEDCKTNIRFMSYKLQLLPILDLKDISMPSWLKS